MAIKLLHPVPGSKVSSRFGWRPAFTENGVWVPAMLHNGTDYAAKAGTPIRAMHSGRVTFAGWDYTGGGNAIKIGSAQYSTMFLHMQSPTKLRPGDHVNAGDVVGYVGSTGLSTAEHLHAMLQIGGQWVDPLPYITSSPTPKPKPKPKPKVEKDDDMTKNSGFYYEANGDPKTVKYLIANAGSGFVSEYGNGPGKGPMNGSYNNAVASAFGTGSFAKITESHAEEIKRACALVRASKA